jgi:hypothetical protein
MWGPDYSWLSKHIGVQLWQWQRRNVPIKLEMDSVDAKIYSVTR